jgi:hypothetical protein
VSDTPQTPKKPPMRFSSLPTGSKVNVAATSTATYPRGVDRPVPRARLGRGVRRAVLTIHIIAVGAWIGIDVVLGVLVFTARSTNSVGTEALAYQALELFAVWPLLAAGLVTFFSGIVLGLGTTYGLVRHWWVAVKLAINLVLLMLVTFALRGAVSEATGYGEALAAGTASDASVNRLFMPPIVSSTALVAATILSVYKPWGRIRRTPQ